MARTRNETGALSCHLTKKKNLLRAPWLFVTNKGLKSGSLFFSLERTTGLHGGGHWFIVG